MTYNDISMNHDIHNPNAYVFAVEENCMLTFHYIYGETRNEARKAFNKCEFIKDTSRRILN